MKLPVRSSNGEDGAALAGPEGALPGDGRRRGRRTRRGDVGSEAAWPLTLPARMLTVIVIGSVLAIGTVHFSSLVVIAAITFAAAAITLGRSAGARLALPLPAVVCAALAAYTLLQALPLPISWLRVLTPTAADVWDRCVLPLGEAGPRWASISLDPGASLTEALKWAVYAAVFVISVAVGARRGAAWGVATVFLAAVAAALTTLVHGLAGATRVYGLYTPAFTPLAWHVGPLLNGNNLAGYLNLGALCGLGLLLAHRPTLPTWLVVPGVAAIVGVEITSASRAGVFVLPIGVVALGILARRREGASSGSRSASTWLMLVAVAGGGALAALGGTYGIWSELYDKDLSKLGMLLWTKPLILDHAWLGIGRGAFESVFPAYRQTPGNVVFTHAENFPAQWVAEWGLPVGLAALALFAGILRPRRLGVHRSSLAAGAWIGVGIVLLQNLLDLALEVPAVCIALATVLGSLWGDARRHPARGGPEGRVFSERSARGAAVGVAIAGLAVIVAALPSGWRDVASERNGAREAFEAAHPLAHEQATSIRGELRQAMRRHPAEPYFPLIGALVAFRAGDEDAIPWLQRTLERAATNGRAHLLLAEVLAAHGARKQALLELRLCVHDDPSLLDPASALAARWARTLDEILIAVPEGKGGSAVLAAIAGRLGAPADAELRALCDQEAIARDPAVLVPRIREANARLTAMAKGSASKLCFDRQRCRAEIAAQVEAIEGLEENMSTAAQLRAQLLVVEDRAEEAVRLLKESCDRFVDRGACLSARVQAAAHVKAPEPLDAAVKDFLSSVCVSGSACADAASWIGELRVSRGETGAGLVLVARAAREDPQNEARWLKLAKMASSAGAHAEAADALEKVARRRGGADPELKRRIDEERGLALGLTAP